MNNIMIISNQNLHRKDKMPTEVVRKEYNREFIWRQDSVDPAYGASLHAHWETTGEDGTNILVIPPTNSRENWLVWVQELGKKGLVSVTPVGSESEDDQERRAFKLACQFAKMDSP